MELFSSGYLTMLFQVLI